MNIQLSTIIAFLLSCSSPWVNATEEALTIDNLDKKTFSLVARLQPHQIEMITAPSDATIHKIFKHVGDKVKHV